MRASEPITLKRDCDAIEVPSSVRHTLTRGATVRVMQSLGGSYTVSTDRGRMYRVDAGDADALGLAPAAEEPAPDGVEASFSEQKVWDQLKSVYDPEIPINIVDLGLIYACKIKPLEQGQYKIEIQMSMTAPGCGMANVLKADVENKLARLSNVTEVQVEVVFDPPWHAGRMSEAAKLQLGLDMDYSPAPSALPIFPDGK
ncbi:MAG: putative Fe-S cluster assembly protein SufT [Candidatus Acidiferrales bacterium]